MLKIKQNLVLLFRMVCRDIFRHEMTNYQHRIILRLWRIIILNPFRSLNEKHTTCGCSVGMPSYFKGNRITNVILIALRSLNEKHTTPGCVSFLFPLRNRSKLHSLWK
jgi:hypothetical protein